MKAAVYTKYGPPEVVHFKELPLPVPKENQVLVKIRAASVAAGDWRMRKADPFAARLFNGLLKPKKVTTLGFELAGEIETIGRRVTKYKIGDRVFATCGLRFGAHAEYYGARVTAVCSTAHVELVRSLGADQVIDYTRDPLTEFGGRFDLVFDAVGKLSKPLARSLPAPHGRFLSAMTSAKRLQGDLALLKTLIESGHVRPVIDKIYPFDEIREAHRYVEQGHKAGNVIIKIQ